MASGPKLLDRIRRTRSGHSERDFFSVLRYYGYQKVREANHGSIWRHDTLASHPDPAVRSLSRVMIPKGSETKTYVAEQVVTSVDTLLALGE
jgi:hypothetical protein